MKRAVVDMHCDTIAEIYYGQEDGRNVELLENKLQLDLKRMKKAGYMVQNFALFTPLGRPRTGGSPFVYGMKLLDVFYEEMEKNQEIITQVTDYAGIEANWKAGKMSALLTLEEGGVCQGDVRLLRDFYRLGVRMMTLTWNFPNELGYPAKVTEGKWKGRLFDTGEYGLTETGIRFVKEMERLGMMIDVSHLNDAGIEDVLVHTTKPFVASHSNARAVCRHPRNLTDELIRKMAQRGCVIGINYGADFLHDWEEGEKAAGRIEHMVEHIRHIRKVGGIGCLGLGSDFDGIDEPLEIASPDQVPLLAEALERAGFTGSEIDAVFYGNVLRVYREVL